MTVFHPRRVLAVDNDPTMLHVIERILGGEANVRGCRDAGSATALIRGGETFNVILCDMLMPGQGGREFYGELLSFQPAAAANVVFMTGASCLAEVGAFLASLPNRWLAKPFSTQELRNVVRGLGRRPGAGPP